MFDFNKGRTTVNQIPVDSRPASAAITTNSQPVPVTTDSTVPAKMPSQVSKGLGSVPPAPGSNAGPEQQSLCNRTNSQPIVEALSLNQSESRTTTNNEHAVQAEDVIAPPDMSAPPAPVATMVGSTDGSLTRNNPMEVSDTQAVDPAHIFARTQGDGLRICPSGITCRRWLKGSKCPYGPACQYQHHYCAKVEAKRPGPCEHRLVGRCMFSEELCAFWHTDVDPKTGYPPNVPSSYNDIKNVLGTIPAMAPSSTAAPAPVSSVKAAKTRPDVVCRFWFQGKCKKLTKECSRAHHRCDRIEAKRLQECKFWKSGYCARSNAECEFYHQELDHTGKPLRERVFQTCPGWKVGSCLKGKDRCEYFHVYFDLYSKEPDLPEAGPSTDGKLFLARRSICFTDDRAWLMIS